MKPIALDLSITVTGPVLVHSSAAMAFGLDAAVLRVPAGPDKDRPYLPFSLIKGKVLDGWLELQKVEPQAFEQAESERLFGAGGRRRFKQTGDLTSGLFLPGDLIARDDETKPDPALTRPTTRSATALEEDFGGAKTGTLRVAETPFGAGQKVTFSGRGYLVVPEAEASALVDKLHQALAWTAQAGAFRTTGFGRVVSTCIAMAEEKDKKDGKTRQGTTESEPETVEIKGDAEGLSVCFVPHVPLSIGRPHVGDNLFPTDTVIPGNMIAGALAATLRSMGHKVLPPGFDEVRFFHARPVRRDDQPPSRPEVPPLSLGATSAGLVDLVDHKAPVLLKDKDGVWTAPAFSTDWKGEDWDNLAKDYPAATPVQETRVRTKIDEKTRRAHKGTGNRDGQLFAIDVVHPFDADDRALGWITRVDLGEVDKGHRPKLIEVLVPALERLAFVGKTKAVCTGDVYPVPPPPEVKLTEGQTLRLTLQTPALLVDPRFQHPPGRSGPIGPGEMQALYKAAWEDLFGAGVVDYSHGFADQAMAGGDVLAQAFKNGTLKGRPYNPWILTQPGSVFSLTVKDAAKATKKVNRWLRHGLDLPTWAVGQWGATWKDHPFLPQNGFGEVLVHTFRCPAPDHHPLPNVTHPLPEVTS